jgi:hypothetical protein
MSIREKGMKPQRDCTYWDAQRNYHEPLFYPGGIAPVGGDLNSPVWVDFCQECDYRYAYTLRGHHAYSTAELTREELAAVLTEV